MANEANLINRGRGRPPGAKNIVAKTVSEMILHALDKNGGQLWFDKLAKGNPKLFAQCVLKLIPLQVVGGQNSEAPLSITVKLTKPEEK